MCCWTTTFKQDEKVCGLVLLYQTGVIEIRYVESWSLLVFCGSSLHWRKFLMQPVLKWRLSISERHFVKKENKQRKRSPLCERKTTQKKLNFVQKLKCTSLTPLSSTLLWWDESYDLHYALLQRREEKEMYDGREWLQSLHCISGIRCILHAAVQWCWRTYYPFVVKIWVFFSNSL